MGDERISLVLFLRALQLSDVLAAVAMFGCLVQALVDKFWVRREGWSGACE